MRNLYSMYILSVLSVGYVHHVKAHPVMPQCGIIPKREGRILNGFSSGENQFPWIASIQQDGAHKCGGTVISRRFIISAAHCFPSSYSSYNWSIVLGMHNLKDDMGKNYTASHRIKKLIQHDGYKAASKRSIKNDIVLIELEDEIKWTDYIQPICLPTVDVREHKDSIAAGWGLDFLRNTGDEENKILRFVKIDIFKNDICNDIYKNRRLRLRLDSSRMCAGKVNTTEIHDTSQGDSGGPLQVNLEGRDILVGITSTGTRESIYPTAPGTYTRVFAYMDWIKEHVDDVYYYPPVLSSRLY